MSAPRTIAAIDAGSNAIRAVVGAVLGRNEWTVLESERIPVRLGHQAFTLGELDADTVDAAVAAFARFRKLFDYHRVERYRAVATSATRTVRNRELLLGRIFYETGIDIEVIDGEEEFRLVHVAVERAYGAAGTPGALLDLGGGSLEVGRKIDDEWQSVSMPIGTVRLMETFALTGAISEDEERLLRRYVGTNADSHGVGAWSLDSEHKAVVTGGNAEALARMFGTPTGGGAQTLTVAQLEQGLSRLLRLSVPERVTAYGIREDRAEVVAIAGLIFSEVVRRLDVQVLEVPGVGVRDGVMLELSGELSSEATEQSRQAALLAQSTGVQTLLLNHVSRRYRERDIVDEARSVFTNTYVVRDFDHFVIPRGAPAYRKGVAQAQPDDRPE